MDRRRVQPLNTSPRDRVQARDGQPEPGDLGLGGAQLLTLGSVEWLRAHLLAAITDDVWAEAATGFGDSDLASE
ncbi:hypothetical protein [Candidatus Poriferisodalis sp.]|uniref:hypothetical protein n=1 Tax=Candidatus Poriferisodalis sp. TaxID=3101277 RepID=UPI003B02819A